MDLKDLGAIGLRIETKGQDLAKMSVIEYVRTVDSSVAKLQSYISRLNSLSNQRERTLAKEIQDNFKYTASIQSLANQREKALAEQARAVNKAATDQINANKRALADALATSRSYQAISRQRERALSEEDRAIRQNLNESLAASRAYQAISRQREQSLAREEAASKAVLRSNMADTQAMLSLARQREREEAAEIARKDQLRASYDRLRGSVNSAEQSQIMYDRSMEILNASMREGIINADEYARVQRNIVQQIAMAGHAVNQFGQVLEGNERMATRWARGGIQQAGYQVNDFFIQIQSGTPFIIAFSQQFSQLVGEFGKWGAVAGAGVAIIGVLISLYQNWHGATEDLTKANDELFKKYDDVLDSIKRLQQEDLSSTFGNLTSEVEKLTESMLKLEQAASMKELKSTLKTLRDNLEPGFADRAFGSIAIGYGADARVIGALAGGPAPKTMDDVLREAKQSNFDELGFQDSFTMSVFEGITKGIDEAANRGDYEQIVIKVREMMQLAFGDVEGYNRALEGGGAALLSTYGELAIKTAEVAAALDGSAESSRLQAEQNKATLQEIAAIEETLYQLRLEQDRTEKENDENRKQRLNELRSIMGEFIAERAAAEEEARKKSEEFAANYIRLVTEPAIEEAIRNTEAAHEGIRDLQLEMERILNRISNTDLSAPFRNVIGPIEAAITKARQLAASLPYMSNSTSGLGSEGGIAWGNTPRGALPAGPGVLLSSPRPREAPIGVGGIDWGISDEGGGGGGGGRREDALQKLQEQIRLEEELLGLTESQQRVYRALGEDRGKYSEQEIIAVTKEIEAIEAKKQAMRDMDGIARTIQQSMSEAFMSMIEGTKSVGDSFKDMARAIIKELYDVLVVQQIVGSWNSTTGTGKGLVGAVIGAFQADGGAWHNGSQIQAFADGGVVNNPTFFGMSGNRTGLMGEAGPEAIMPLKRGSDGKLGVAVNGGSVSESISVTNNISISGSNDPAAMREEIKKAVPQIVEATKAAVIQARKRGGEMRRTFGGT